MTIPIRHSQEIARALSRTLVADALVAGLRALWLPLMILAVAGALGGLTQRLPAPVMSLFAGLALLLEFVASGPVVQTYAPITQPKAQRLM
ncbi:MAG: hypothetical protein RL186_1876, partial [Pseudomonadota bacterium]